MNQEQYRQAAIELGKIPGMERSPVVLVANFSFTRFEPQTRQTPPALLDFTVGPWLNIDDFSDWSAAKIAQKISTQLFPSDMMDRFNGKIREEFDSNLDVVQFIIESYKINPAHVIAALPKD